MEVPISAHELQDLEERLISHSIRSARMLLEGLSTYGSVRD